MIMLNSAVKGKVDGHLSSEQLENLANLLEQFADHPVLLACHHHPFAMKSKWIDHHKLQNSNALLDTLSPFQNVKALVCGHVHQDSLNIWQGIEFFLRLPQVYSLSRLVMILHSTKMHGLSLHSSE